ncbi:MAG TPA: ABC transporter ATP-binding protein [Vicinamibacterales bacterium]
MPLTASEVTFAYRGSTPVLRGVTLTVAPGEITGLLGPNGSGKTTLLRLLAGTERPQSGHVTLDGSPVSRFSRAELARRIAVVPQETHLAFDYTVAEVAMMGRYAHLGPFEIEGPDDLTVVDESLSATGTRQLRDRPFSTLSGGEKQRVIIAAALAQIAARSAGGGVRGAGVLLLDEPTTSLDVAYQLDVAALLKRLHRERGLSIVISTHDLSLAATLCESITMLREGQVVASGPVRQALTKDSVRRAFDIDVDLLEHAGQQLVVPVGRAPLDGSSSGAGA